MSGEKFTAGLYHSLKRLTWADHFYHGDLSFLEDREQVLEYLPVYKYMFYNQNDFFVGDLDFENINELEVNRSLTLMQKYLKPNPYTDEKYVVSSWILSSDKNDFKKPNHLKKILDIKVDLVDVIDLGDSRNFNSVNQIIRSIEYIQQSKMYVGSQTSWDAITRLYNKPVIKILPL